MSAKLLYTAALCGLLFSNGFAQTATRGIMAPKPTADSTITNGNIYAVIVGVSNYKYLTPLSFADQDALLFRDFLLSKAGGGTNPGNILLLLNNDANASAQPRIRHWLNETKKPQKGDRVYFYFADHGDAIDADEYFFLLQDCNPAGDANNYVGGFSSVLQMYNLKAFIKNSLIASGVQVVFIWDACRTHELPGGENGLNITNEGITEKNNGELMMISASAGQVALENNNYAHGHGLFTYYLVDGLSGAADRNHDGKVKIEELDTWVKSHVEDDADAKFHTAQTPKFIYNNNAIIGRADSVFDGEWALQKANSNSTMAYAKRSVRAAAGSDSMLNSLYNSFMAALKTDSIEGGGGAEELYAGLLQKYPTGTLTEEAGFNLAVEYINLAQDKINLYLAGKNDPLLFASASDNYSPNDLSLKRRYYKTANLQFNSGAKYIYRSIDLLKNSSYKDTDYFEQLEGKAAFLLARSYYDDEGEVTDEQKAFHFASISFKTQPGAAYNYLLLGLLYSKKRAYDSSMYYEKQALRLAPKWVYIMTDLANNFKVLHKYDSAEMYYRRAIHIDSKYIAGYNNLGVNFYNQKRYDSAMLYFRKTIAVEPKNIFANNNIGVILNEQKEFDSAEIYFRRAILSDPKYFDAYNDIGVCFHDQKKFDSADAYYRKTLFFDPKNLFANNNMGANFEDQNNYDSAKVYLANALAIDSQNFTICNNIGNLFLHQKKYDSAEVYYRKAIALGPTDFKAYNNLAKNFLDHLQYDSAELYYRKVVALDSAYFPAYNNIGFIFDKKNLYDSAKIFWEKAIAINPKFVIAIQIWV